MKKKSNLLLFSYFILMSASECVSMIEQSFDIKKVDIPTHMKTKQPSKPDFTGLPEGAAFPYILSNFMPPQNKFDELVEDIQKKDDLYIAASIADHIINELSKKYPNENPDKFQGFKNFMMTNSLSSLNQYFSKGMNTNLLSFNSSINNFINDTSNSGTLKSYHSKVHLAYKILALPGDQKHIAEFKTELKKILKDLMLEYDKLKTLKVPTTNFNLLEFMKEK